MVVVMASVEEQLQELLVLVRDLAVRHEGQGLPVLLGYPSAAAQLSISVSKLKGLVRSGELRTSTVGRRKMIPLSEVLRVAAPEEPFHKPNSRGRPGKGPRGGAPLLSPKEEAAKLRAALKLR